MKKAAVSGEEGTEGGAGGGYPSQDRGGLAGVDDGSWYYMLW